MTRELPLDVFIASAKRTPLGTFQGALSGLSAPELAGAAIAEACKQGPVAPGVVDEVVLGNVLAAGLGQAPARQAGVHGGLPLSVPATAVSKVCGSGMRAVIDASDRIAAGSANIVVAGGMESMSRAPYLSDKTRGGARLGHIRMIDHMFHDGLEDAYDRGRLMGSCAEECAQRYGFTREDQDAYAQRSIARAQAALQEGRFAAELCPVTVRHRKEERTVSQDEQPGLARSGGLSRLRPAFREAGTITAGNASTISDGAAALVIGSGAALSAAGARRRARIVGHAGHAQEPVWFSTAPAPAVRKLLDRIGWRVGDVDLWEVNEAFAVVAMAFIRDLELDPERVNVNGGAVSLGHPIGASGARIIVTLLHALEARRLKRGIAAICIGGGEALAVAIERE